MRKTLSDKGVASLKPRPSRYIVADPQMVGLYIRIYPTGRKSFVAVTVDQQSRKQVWHRVGPCDTTTIAAAREQARKILSRIRAGQAPIEAKTATFETVSNDWLARHVDTKGLRSAYEIRRLLNSHILPRWRHKEFVAIDRSDITALLDKVEDDHGPRGADYCLSITRAIANWYAARVNGYHPPFVRGMRRSSPLAQARERILSDDEIREVWRVAGESGTYGGIVKLLLLTGQRKTKVRSLKWDDVNFDTGEWTIASEAREKGNAGFLILPAEALAVIKAQPRFSENPFVFVGRTAAGPLNGMQKSKVAFDAKLPEGFAEWTIHDLRRSARSLMARAGVSSDHAERVLGHAIPGIAAVYDRHSYSSEKAAALRSLAALIEEIVNPPKRTNVTLLREKAAR